MSDVIIEVRGGNIIEVYGLSEKTRVTIVEWDNWKAGDISTSAYTVHCLPVSKIPEKTMSLIIANETKPEK